MRCPDDHDARAAAAKSAARGSLAADTIARQSESELSLAVYALTTATLEGALDHAAYAARARAAGARR